MPKKSENPFDSQQHRKTVKRMIERYKTVYGIHGKIKKGFPKKLKANASEKERESFAKEKNRFLTVDTFHYFAAPFAPRIETQTGELKEVIAEKSGKEPDKITY